MTDRRDFLKTLAAGLAALGAPGAARLLAKAEEPRTMQLTREALVRSREMQPDYWTPIEPVESISAEAEWVDDWPAMEPRRGAWLRIRRDGVTRELGEINSFRGPGLQRQTIPICALDEPSQWHEPIQWPELDSNVTLEMAHPTTGFSGDWTECRIDTWTWVDPADYENDPDGWMPDGPPHWSHAALLFNARIAGCNDREYTLEIGERVQLL